MRFTSEEEQVKDGFSNAIDGDAERWEEKLTYENNVWERWVVLGATFFRCRTWMTCSDPSVCPASKIQ